MFVRKVIDRVDLLRIFLPCRGRCKMYIYAHDCGRPGSCCGGAVDSSDCRVVCGRVKISKGEDRCSTNCSAYVAFPVDCPGHRLKKWSRGCYHFVAGTMCKYTLTFPCDDRSGQSNATHGMGCVCRLRCSSGKTGT